MKKIFALAFVLPLFCMTSCHKEVVVCDIPNINLSFAGFTATDFSNAIIYTYRKDGAFDSLVDSAALITASAGPDTFSDNHVFSYQYDYKLVMPAISATYLVTGITPGTHYTETVTTSIGNTKKYGCVNTITSYLLNGKAYNVNAGYDLFINLYIYK